MNIRSFSTLVQSYPKETNLVLVLGQTLKIGHKAFKHTIENLQGKWDHISGILPFSHSFN